ncbi:hypothetical protein HMPREF0476_0214, partial [Kingella kingae ATCC 23330]
MNNNRQNSVCFKSQNQLEDPIQWIINYYNNYGLQAATDLSPYVLPGFLNYLGEKGIGSGGLDIDSKLKLYKNLKMAETYTSSTTRKEGVYSAKAIRQDILKNKIPEMRQAMKSDVYAQTSRIMKHVGNGFAYAGATYEIGKSLVNPETKTKDFVKSSIKGIGILGTTAALSLLPATIPIALGATVAVASGIMVSALLDGIMKTEEFNNLFGDIGEQELGQTWQYLTEDFFDDVSETFEELAKKFIDDNYDIYSERISDSLDNFPINKPCNNFDPYHYRYRQLNKNGKAHGYDPLILNLDGKGIQTIAPSSISARFDHNADGIATATGWTAAGNGILALDLDKNGKIDSG